MNMPVTYHMPDRMGIQSLNEVKDKTLGYIVGGSASNVTEPLPWHKPLSEFLLNELENGKPVFGCCFGHQLLCYAFGSEVGDYYADGTKIKGLREILITRDLMGFNQGEKYILPVTHKQSVKTLGNGLISLGTGLPNDMVVHDKLPMMTTQGHPEASIHFCNTDIGVLTQEEIAIGRKSGKLLITKFFNTHLK